MINFLVDNLSASQMSYTLTKELNSQISQDSSFDPIIFFNDVSKLCMQPNFAIMGMSESYISYGPAIATCRETAKILLGNLGQSIDEKYFYVWDLEWMRDSRKIFENNRIYWENLKLIARSESHRRIIKSCFGRDVIGLVEDFNMKELLSLVGISTERSQNVLEVNNG